MSNSRKVKEQIGNLFETCLEQFEQISNYDGKIPQIEIDIIMGNMRIMYDHFVQLNKLNNNEETLSEIKQTENEKSHPVVHEINTETKKESSERDTSKTEMFNHSDPVTSKSPEPVASVLSHMESISQKNKPTNQAASLFDNSADNDDDEMPSINERITKNKVGENSLADRLKQNRIKDLKQAIGINEKFLFINELFEGSLNEYNNAISQINALNSKDEADNYIESELKLKYKWNETSKAQSIFIQLVERRFS